jgi:hypothetical protein
MAAVSEVHEHVVPALHLSLRETRLELERMRELARQLAVALDAHVDEAYGGRAPTRSRRAQRCTRRGSGAL